LVKKKCNHPIKSDLHTKQRSTLPFLGGVLLVILPKCPFCILAYSSAITLCSGSKMYMHSPGWTSWISIALAALTFLMVAINFRGNRTWVALAMIFTGSLLIIRTELYTGELTDYYIGASVLFFGVWVNASFYYFYRKYIQPIGHFLRNQIKD